jgi:hypothetical protein
MIGVREVRSLIVENVFLQDAQAAASLAAGKQSVERLVDGFW